MPHRRPGHSGRAARERRGVVRPRAVVLLSVALAALAFTACGDDDPSEGEIVVVPPELNADRPPLPKGEWKDSVLDVCAETQREVEEASARVAAEIQADSSELDEAAVSALLFEQTRPIIEEQLAALAQFPPPERLREAYEELILQLALDLELTGRVAISIDDEGGTAEAAALTDQLGAVGERARRLIRRLGIEGCLPGA